jgi:hypothetical protein
MTEGLTFVPLFPGVMTNVSVPALVGVPANVIVEPDTVMVTPGGKEPVVTVAVYGGVPPEIVRTTGPYGTPT